MPQQIDSCYRRSCEITRTTDIKRPFNLRQEQSSTGVEDVTFADRLKQVCGSEDIAEIARKIGKPYQTVKNYIELGRTPDTDILLDIHHSTGVSIHWLLVGEGPIYPEGKVAYSTGQAETLLLDENQKLFIERLSVFNDRSFTKELKEIIYEGLDARSKGFSVSYRQMNRQQLEEVLDAFLSNTVRDEGNNRDAGPAEKRA